MKDDDFSNIVRSGTAHSVNVSEYTGNAKAPKNIVRSDDSAEHARKERTPEEIDAALYLEKLHDASDTGHVETPRPGGSTQPNVQSVEAGVAGPAHRHALPGEGGIAANVQHIDGSDLAVNRQAVGIDRLQDNHAALPNEGFQDRTHRQGQDPLQDRRAAVPEGASPAAHRSTVEVDRIEERQASQANTSDSDNRQGLGQEALADRFATVPKDTLSDNRQSAASESLTPNRVALPSDGSAGAPLSDEAALASNRAAGSREGASSPTSIEGTQATPIGSQPSVQTTLQDNTQALAKEGLQDNVQALSKDTLQDNVQNLPGEDVPHNRQAAPEAAPLDDRFPGVAKDAMADHHEPLPETGAGLGAAPSAPSSAVQSGTPSSPPPTSRVNASAKGHTATTSAQRAVPTAAQAAAHNKAMDAFHGRLAGIKQTVDQLNHRLSDFEAELQKQADALPADIDQLKKTPLDRL